MRAFLLSSLLLTLGTSSALAQKTTLPANASSHLLETKTRLEEMISQRYKGTISTVLSQDTFEVSTQVNIFEIKAKRGAALSQKKMDDPNPDLTLGMIDSAYLLQRYQEELERLKQEQSIPDTEKEFGIRSVSVFVGLQETYGEPYLKEFQTWLQNQVKAEFGAKGQASVQFIKTKPEKPKEPDQPKTWAERFQEFQYLLGVVLAVLALMTGLLLWKFLPSRDALEQRKMALKVNQEASKAPTPETAALPTPKKEEEPLAPAIDPVMLTRITKDLRTQITWLAFDLHAQLSDITQTWINSGERGFLKSVCLSDALAGFRERHPSTAEIVRINWKMEVAPHLGQKLLETFQKMPLLTAEERSELLKEVYWDLLAFRMLGPETFVPPFGYLATLPPEQLAGALDHQDLRVKALVVLHMGGDAKNSYLKKLDKKTKVELVAQTLQMDKILSSDIKLVDQTLHKLVKGSGHTSQEISVKPLIPRVLETLSETEELTILRELATSHTEHLQSMKKVYPTLAFLNEFSPAALSTLLAQARPEELDALIRVVPDHRTAVLNAAPPRLATIVGDDLDRADRQSTEEKNKNLRRLKDELKNLIAGGQLSLENLYSNQETEGSSHAA